MDIRAFLTGLDFKAILKSIAPFGLGAFIGATLMMASFYGLLPLFLAGSAWVLIYTVYMGSVAD